MVTNFPAGIDDNSTLPTNIAPDDRMRSPSHSGQHDNLNAAVRALQAKVGKGASLPVQDYVLTGQPDGSTIWALPPVLHDASSTSKGILKLIGGLLGDLGGTADNPRIKRTNRLIVAPYGDTRPADYTCANATANDVEINAACQAAMAIGNGCAVDLLDGDFVTSASIIPLPKVWLRGQGMFSTRITTIPNARFAILDNYDEYPAVDPWYNGIVSDMELDGSNINRAFSHKCFNASSAYNCKIMRLYAHDSTATGIGTDDFTNSTITECIVVNCGYVNKRTITAASWAANVMSFTTSTAHGYSPGDVIVVTSMVPVYYNGKMVISTTPTSTTFTVAFADNSASLNLNVDPGTATTFGYTSDSIIGHNGIGVASGATPSMQSTTVTNNFCIGNQNNNLLIEADQNFTGAIASYIYSNNFSVNAGMVGYLNTGTPNFQCNNNFDFGSPTGFTAAPVEFTRTITAASWSGGVATFTLSVTHNFNLITNNRITVSGMTPSGYNGYFTITSIPAGNQFTVAMPVNPGASTVMGTVSYAYHVVDGTQFSNNISAFNLNYALKLPNNANGVIANANTFKYCYGIAIQFSGSHTTITNNDISYSGRQAIYVVTGSGNKAPMAHNLIQGNHIRSNGRRLTLKDGIDVDSVASVPITNLIISGNQAYDDQDVKTQRYGCILRSGGSLANISVYGNDFTGNLTGTMLVQDTTDNTISVYNNLGVNPNAKYDMGTVTGSPVFDRSIGDFIMATLGGNITPTMPAALVRGSVMTLRLVQDGTGSRTITWPSNFKKAGGTLTLSTAAGAIDTITAEYDGTNWVEISRALNLS